MRVLGQQPIVIGLFEHGRDAQLAVRDLEATGFSRRQLGLAFRHGELLQADGALAELDAPEHDVLGGLISLGLPVAQARVCAQQFERGRAIVAVRHERDLPPATDLLRAAGAAEVVTARPEHR